jgi:hypothetical protein
MKMKAAWRNGEENNQRGARRGGGKLAAAISMGSVAWRQQWRGKSTAKARGISGGGIIKAASA